MTKLRWTIGTAASEWATNVKTIALGIRTLGIIPGDDGMFSTIQIDKALHGDFEVEKTRDTAASADTRELKLANLRRENIPAYNVERVVGALLSDLRQQITYLEIPDDKKADILRNLQAIPIDEYFTAGNTEEKESEEE